MALSEMLRDSKTPGPDQCVLEKDDLETIRKLLDAIDEREATILRMRYGLDGHEPLTLKEIGKQVGLTRERVRQIEIESLRKLNERLKQLNGEQLASMEKLVEQLLKEMEENRPIPKRAEIKAPSRAA